MILEVKMREEIMQKELREWIAQKLREKEQQRENAEREILEKKRRRVIS